MEFVSGPHQEGDVPLDPVFHLIAIRSALAEKFDSHNVEGSKKVFAEFARLCEAQALTEAVREDVGDRRMNEALALFLSTWSTLVSAYQLLRQMDAVSANTLMRLALETASSAYAILTCDDHYKKYLAHEFRASKCITVAARAVPLVGSLYGALSQRMVHPNRAVHGPFLRGWSRWN
jgi:hypothetical protein